MKALLRNLLVVLAGLLSVLPLTGDDGNGGDSGVWILPRSRNVTSGFSVVSETTPRAIRHLTTLANPFVMKVSSEMGAPVGTLTDPVSNLQLPLLVSGNCVTIPAATLQSLASAAITQVAGVIVDQAGLGYMLVVRIDPAHRTADIDLY